MPLKLIERVLPWLVRFLGEEEQKCFLKNMQMAGGATLCFFYNIISELLSIYIPVYNYVFFLFIYQIFCLMQLQLQMLHLSHFFLVGLAKVVKGMSAYPPVQLVVVRQS